MIINRANLTALWTGYRTSFNDAFSGVEPDWQKVAMLVKSQTAKETYGWLGKTIAMRRWAGDRQVQNLKAHDFTITNEKYEATVSVGRDEIEDGVFAMADVLFKDLGLKTARYPDKLVFDLLAAGFTSLCYDGQYFFDDDHPVGSGTVSNLGAGSATPWFLLDTNGAIKPLIFQQRKPPQLVKLDREDDENVFMRGEFLYGVDMRGAAGYGMWQQAFGSKATLSATNYAAARAAMMAFKSDDGEPLGIRPNLLVVPPSLEGAAREILLAERDDAGATNVWRGTADLLVTERLA